MGKLALTVNQGRQAATKIAPHNLLQFAIYIIGGQSLCLQPFGGNIPNFNSHVSNLTEIEKGLINSEPLEN